MATADTFFDRFRSGFSESAERLGSFVFSVQVALDRIRYMRISIQPCALVHGVPLEGS